MTEKLFGFVFWSYFLILDVLWVFAFGWVWGAGGCGAFFPGGRGRRGLLFVAARFLAGKSECEMRRGGRFWLWLLLRDFRFCFSSRGRDEIVWVFLFFDDLAIGGKGVEKENVPIHRGDQKALSILVHVFVIFLFCDFDMVDAEFFLGPGGNARMRSTIRRAISFSSDFFFFFRQGVYSNM